MYLLTNSGDYRNGDTDSYIKSHMDTLEQAGLTFSIRDIVRFLKSGIPIYNSEVPDMADRKKGKEEKQKQLQSVLRFTQRQKILAALLNLRLV